MLSPKFKKNLYKIIPFGIIWLLFGICYTLLEKGLLGDLTYYPSTGNPYDFGGNTVAFIAIVLVSGLLIGTFEVFYFNQLFSKKSFSKKIAYKSLVYVLVIIIFLLVNTVVSNAYMLNLSVFNKEVWSNVWTFFVSFAFLSVIVYITLIIGFTLFFSELADNLGVAVFYNYFFGKYHSPIEEERVFMFLDMKSSTTIAENLGHVKYFELLKEYYSEFSDPIINNGGEIYQYVGDEIIVSWKLKNGLKNNGCLQCFFDMKKSMNKESKKYDVKFGVLPSFKAGLHVGKVTTGEIGGLKKEIIFTGDVLNTTARIQSLCNIHNVDILISSQLRTLLSNGSEFKFQSFGKNEIKGRKEQVELFTVLSK